MKPTWIECSIVIKESVIVLCLVLNGLFMQGQANAQVLADSVADWQAAEANDTNDGIVSQGEFNWEYGYISTYTGGGGEFYGWHQNPFFWESSRGIIIYWPIGQDPPNIAWGEGGDSTGCRPPMSWIDGGYPWAGSDTDKWASVRRWTSDYTGRVKITGQIGRYFDTSVITGWDIDFSVALNADFPGTPAIYTKQIAWDDTTVYSFVIDNVMINAGDTINFIINAASWNANNSHMKMTATISCLDGDLNCDDNVDMLDYSLFTSKWPQTDCVAGDWCGGADFDHSGEVNYLDLAVFVLHWLE
jgi:hypothetical protein